MASAHESFRPAFGENRREVLEGAPPTLAMPLAAEGAPAREPPAYSGRGPRRRADVVLKVNGQDHRLSIDSRTSLLDALRDHIGLTGTKKGCDHGQCGACTVHIEGKSALSCLVFAVMAEGREIGTVEGLAAPGELHPMQQAFVDHDGLQCGYCTPGQIMSAIACVNEGCAETDASIREYTSGNLCRCAAYPNIVAAVRQGRDAMKKSGR